MKGIAFYECLWKVAHEDWIMNRHKKNVAYTQIHAKMLEKYVLKRNYHYKSRRKIVRSHFRRVQALERK